MPDSLSTSDALARVRGQSLSTADALARVRAKAPKPEGGFFSGVSPDVPEGVQPAAPGPAFTAGTPETAPVTTYSPDAAAPYAGRNPQGEPMFSSSGEPTPNVSHDDPTFSILDNLVKTVASTTAEPVAELLHPEHPDQPQGAAGIATRGVRMASTSFLPFTAPLGVMAGASEAAESAGVDGGAAKGVIDAATGVAEAPFTALDEKIVSPISELFDDPEVQELVREGGNFVGALALGKGMHSAYRGAKGAVVKGAKAVNPMRAEPLLPDAAEVARRAPYKGKVDIDQTALRRKQRGAVDERIRDVKAEEAATRKAGERPRPLGEFREEMSDLGRMQETYADIPAPPEMKFAPRRLPASNAVVDPVAPRERVRIQQPNEHVGEQPFGRPSSATVGDGSVSYSPARTPLEVAEARTSRPDYRPKVDIGAKGKATATADPTPVPEAKGGRLNRNIESFRDSHGPEGQLLSDELGKWQVKSREYHGRVTTDPDTEFRRIVNPKHRDIAAKNIGNWIENRGEVPEWGQKFYRSVLKGVRANAENTIDANLLIQDNARGWRQMNPDAEVFTHRIEHDIVQRLYEQSREGHKGPKPDLDKWMAEGDNASKPNPFATEALDPNAPPGRRLEGGPGSYAGAEKARVYDVPVEFMPEDQFSTLRSHWRRTSMTAAENKVFKQTRQNAETGHWTRDAGELGRIYDRVTQNMGAGEAKKMKHRVDRIMERLDTDALSENAKAANRAFSLWTMSTKLAGSVTQIVQQSSQLGTQAVVNPGATARGIGRVAKIAARETRVEVAAALRDGGGVREITRAIANGLTAPATKMRKTGAGLPDAYTQSLDLADAHGGSKPMRMARRVTDFAQTAQMSLDTISRAVAYESAPIHTKAIRDALAKGGRKAEWAQQQMIDLDLPKDYRQAITRGEMTPEIENHIRTRWTAYLNVESGVAEFPRMIGDTMSDPRFLFARQLAGFQMGQTRVFHEQVTRPLFLKGNAAPAIRYAAIGTVIGELIHTVNENVPLIGKERQRDRKSWDEITTALDNGDSGPLMRRLGQNIGRSGMGGYADVLVSMSAAEGAERKRELMFDVKRKLPPIVADAVTIIEGAAGAAFNPSREDKIRESLREGKVDLHLGTKEQDRIDVMLRELANTLRKIMPQAYRVIDQTRARVDDEYNKSERAETLKNDGMPRKGRETRLKHLIDIGQK